MSQAHALQIILFWFTNATEVQCVIAPRLKGCKPTHHTPVARGYVGEKLGIVREAASILVVCRRREHPTSADVTGRFTKNWAAFAKMAVCLSQNEKVVAACNSNSLCATLLVLLIRRLQVSNWKVEGTVQLGVVFI